MRLTGLLVLMVLVPGCTAPIPSGTSAAEGRTRFAMQVVGYVGSAEDGRTTLQLAFVDRGASKEPTAADFSSLIWITTGARIPAQVDSITSSPAGPMHRLVTMASSADSLASGEYVVTAIEYQDAGNRLRRLEIGTVLLDVRQVQQPPRVNFPNYTIGQTRLQFIELSVENTSIDLVTVRGLEFEVPGVVVETSMWRVGDRPLGQPTGRPEPAAHGEAVDSVVIAPGQTVELRFDFTVDNSEALRFSELAPYLNVASGGITAVVAVPLQVYFGSFAGDDDLTLYLESLPPSASHPL